ncbi:MAG: hypothetical protein OHK0046_35590 [Anaerolineae bacterium]
MGVINLIYGSSASTMMSDEELLDILQTSRRNNARLGVTGMLLYKDGNFLQVLEGEEDVVMSLYEKIAQDPRHHQVLTILKRPVEKREFAEWEMGFYNISKADYSQVEGYNEFMNVSLHAENFFNNPAFAYRFLQVFKEVTTS